MEDKAHIVEIFSSIQGEGVHVGQRQTFVRFKGCNLFCKYCDTKTKKKALLLTVDDIVSKICKIDKKLKQRVVSITGGEPLLNADFLKILLPKLKKLKFKVYLETNATLVDELKKVIKYIDIIAADIKLPSVTKDKAQWSKHSSFLKMASKKELFVKVIVSNNLKPTDFNMAIHLVKKINFKIPFIIQPAMRKKNLLMGKISIDSLQERAMKHLDNVLVIPQTHKIIGVK